MSILGQIVSIVRYPVKSMSGELLARAYLAPYGLDRDRLYAFESSSAPAGMLRLTARERRQMLQYHPHVRTDGGVEVLTPDGKRYPIDSAPLLHHLQANIADAGSLSLMQSLTPQTDVRPLSLLSLPTVEALSKEFGMTLGERRFRANMLVNLVGGAFAEDALVGRQVRIGKEAKLLIRERIPRCRFITYDPDAPPNAEPLFSLMKLLDRRYEGRVGVYASVTTPGWIEAGDDIWEEG
ncbi:MOSC domain-containing protein [Granulicella aggregans]|uniref:MOSC domain-containing protein n=1 Tax=Granulicella aggregans TaxID=474949 RepID=UPI0021E00144|nr:MOSC domain-containing protein [Granulicella aggregans]